MTVFASAIILAVANSFAQVTWSLDKTHTKLGFTTTHLMMSETTGDFKKYDVKITSKDETFEGATFEATIDVNSINTDVADRDNHLKGPDFFDAAKYPNITFKSKTFKKVDGKKFKLEGDLTMHGVTKPVVLDVTFNGVNDHPMMKGKRFAGFKFSTTLKRTDFGVGTYPAAVVGEDITIAGSMEFFRD